MAIAGSLGVNILAITDKFERGIDKALKKLNVFRKGTKAFGTGLSKLQGQLIALAGPSAMGALLFRTTSALDEISKLSTQLGIAGDQLQFLQFAGQRAGVQFNVLTMALQRMERRLGEVAFTGRGEAAKALEQLNLNAREIVMLKPDQQFMKIAEAIGEVTNQNRQLALTQKIFDSEGVRVLRLFNEDMGVLAERFQELGGGISGKGLQDATRFVDTLTDLKTAGALVGQKLIIDIAPTVTKALEGLLLARNFLERQGESFGAFLSETDFTKPRIKPGAFGRPTLQFEKKRPPASTPGDAPRQQAFREPQRGSALERLIALDQSDRQRQINFLREFTNFFATQTTISERTQRVLEEIRDGQEVPLGVFTPTFEPSQALQ